MSSDITTGTHTRSRDDREDTGGPNWICPNCGGGFPDPTVPGPRSDAKISNAHCPWCMAGLEDWDGQ